MGVYVFNHQLLLEALTTSAMASGQVDFGEDIMPRLIPRQRVMAYDFVDENKKLSVYWRDVGTIDSYWAANMDLLAPRPPCR